MNKGFKTILAAICAATAAAAQAADFGAEAVDGAAWDMTVKSFCAAHAGEGFRFLTSARDSVNCTQPGAVNVAGFGVYETRIWFSGPRGAEPKISRAEFSLYNKGDAGKPLSREDLDAMLEAVRASFPAAEARWEKGTKNEKMGAVVHSQRFFGKKADGQLAWGTDKRGGTVNFVRLALVPPGTMKRTSEGALSRSAESVKSGVEKRKNGDVVINGVPMVDQGEKGYCAAATAERVLRYYGLEIDEHELAQMAGTTADGGTGTGAMIDAVAKIGNANRLGKNELYRADGDMRTFEKNLELYNQTAKRMRRPQIDIRQYTTGNMVDGNAISDAYDPDVLKAARLKQSAAFKRFMAGVKTQVDRGVPLFWGVTLGYVKEPDIPQARGGHMRLITGYNEKTKEIIYTDTWGAGHEEKRMSQEDAWTITTALFFLKPLR